MLLCNSTLQPDKSLSSVVVPLFIVADENVIDKAKRIIRE